jgi:hypothetical protein
LTPIIEKNMKGLPNRFNFSVMVAGIMTISLFAGMSRSFAQPMEGKIRFLATHNWAKMMAAVDYLSKLQRDKVTYIRIRKKGLNRMMQVIPGEEMYMISTGSSVKIKFLTGSSSWEKFIISKIP